VAKRPSNIALTLKDPTWRHQASYTRAEVETLLSDERVLPDRRILYALKALAALRHTEAATLTWAMYDAAAKPLGSINLGQTKSGVPRQVPVHPTLAKLLAAWKLSGWCAVYGRKPTADDFIVPTRNMSEDRPRGTTREAGEAQRQLVADLRLLDLRTKAGTNRRRRGHDLRRTFISLARTDGALDGPLRWVTHGPSVTNMTELYTTFTWDALCTEVAKLKLALREGTLVPLANTGVDRWLKPATVRGRENERAPAGNQRAADGGVFVQPLAAIAGMKATPTRRHAIGTTAHRNRAIGGSGMIDPLALGPWPPVSSCNAVRSKIARSMGVTRGRRACGLSFSNSRVSAPEDPKTNLALPAIC
jgi:hypothetical protein